MWRLAIFIVGQPGLPPSAIIAVAEFGSRCLAPPRIFVVLIRPPSFATLNHVNGKDAMKI